MASTLERIKDVLNRLVPCKDATEETTLASLHLDSLDLTELAIALEDEFNCQLDDETVESFQKLGDFVAYFDKQGGQ